MTSNKITAIVLAALAGFGLLKYFQMSAEERQEFIAGVKARLHELLDDVEASGDRAKQYMAQLKSTSDDNWLDKLVVIKKIIDEVKPAASKIGSFGANAANAANSARTGRDEAM